MLQRARKMVLTSEQIIEAKRRRALPKPDSYEDIALSMGIGTYVLKCEIVPGFRQRVARQVKESRRRRIAKNKPDQVLIRRGTRNYFVSNAVGHQVSEVTIPPQVLAERDHRLSLVPRSLSAVMFNDPLPGYSALDKLHANAN